MRMVLGVYAKSKEENKTVPRQRGIDIDGRVAKIRNTTSNKHKTISNADKDTKITTTTTATIKTR